jgi:hypothetical protein
MHLLEKVYQSRLTLKDVLMSEWDTSVINDVSMKELEIMYNNQNDKTIYLLKLLMYTAYRKKKENLQQKKQGKCMPVQGDANNTRSEQGEEGMRVR